MAAGEIRANFPHMWRLLLIGALLATFLAIGPPASAGLVTVPLRIDYLTLDAALKQQVYNGPDGRAELWHGSNVCDYFYATNPRFGPSGSAVKLETEAELSVGVPIGNKCISPVRWSGIIEAEAAPYIGPGITLKFHVTDINLYNMKHEKTLLVGRGFDLVKTYLIPRLETFSFDLKPPLDQLEELVRDATTPEVAERVKAALSTLRPIPPVAVLNGAVKLTLQLIVPESTAPIVSGPAPPLTPAQLAAWQTTLDNWDAFIVFAVKQLGFTAADPQLRRQLFALLLDSRHRLLKALAEPRNVGTGPDPVRLLFLDVWNRMSKIVRSAARQGLLHNRSIQFLSFISAGDALFALDEAAPALGMRISADDLRRLARIMAPQTIGNPLAYDFNEDPQLQQLFGLTEPPETPGLLVVPAEKTVPVSPPEPTASPSATPAPASKATPAAASGSSATPASRSSASPAGQPSSAGSTASPEPPAPHTPAPSPSAPGTTATPMSIQSQLLNVFGPTEVFAADTAPTSELSALGKKLRLVVVSDANVDSYGQNLKSLLVLTAQRELTAATLQPAYRHTYQVMVRATAWQESCWRQYVRRKGRISYLESSTGDIGLMQVNKYVWRGFFRLPRLKWDIVYNAGAGAEVLMKMMRGALDNGADRGGATGGLARSTYAAYNGGPGAYNRWRKASEPRRQRLIDRAFWAKYRFMERNRGFDILGCAAEWPGTQGK
jgi:Transglycosylase SLT domain